MAGTDPITLRVDRTDEDTGTVRDIGRLAFHPGGALTLVSADPDHRAALEAMVGAINSRKSFRINVPPPADAPQFSLYAMDVERGDPDLLSVAKTFVQQRYGLVLSEAD
jgi:hypothetical protein